MWPFPTVVCCLVSVCVCVYVGHMSQLCENVFIMWPSVSVCRLSFRLLQFINVFKEYVVSFVLCMKADNEFYYFAVERCIVHSR